ncbi:sigma-70 family RNA polymerase sigma factor [Adhaeretor mobilis]|uniref:ECF RNA polymerase sigma factor SigK n=1 Tax=Adhaeretor mobilis TaxID=1930276 RepID=A0A517N2H6_9BACT|nr:sigma-70 family RNA polymerase sigma factor [Adhaeretor mobilis]QDT01331.1 ECF RNA polymerase sigma factor SigK [Adhaeretor mobilis]
MTARDSELSTNDETADDGALMQQVAQGCEAALAELYDRHSGRLYGICLKILRRPADAQAALSDIFYEIWRRADRFNPERGQVRTYFTTLARSRAIDRLRSDSTRTNHEREYSRESSEEKGQRSQTHDPVQAAIIDETMQFVRETLRGLPEDQQTCLETAYFEGLTQQEISARLGLPLGTVKTHIRGGLEKLRQAVSAFEAGTHLEPKVTTNKPR